MNFDVYKKFDELDNTRNNLQNFLIEAQESLKKFNLDFTPNSFILLSNLMH